MSNLYIACPALSRIPARDGAAYCCFVLPSFAKIMRDNTGESKNRTKESRILCG
jgi:hypothetical protein